MAKVKSNLEDNHSLIRYYESNLILKKSGYVIHFFVPYCAKLHIEGAALVPDGRRQGIFFERVLGCDKTRTHLDLIRMFLNSVYYAY